MLPFVLGVPVVPFVLGVPVVPFVLGVPLQLLLFMVPRKPKKIEKMTIGIKIREILDFK